MGVVDQTMNQMGYGSDIANALKILSSDQSKKIMQAVAMNNTQPNPVDFANIQLYTSNQMPNTPDVINLAQQTAGASAQLRPEISQPSVPTTTASPPAPTPTPSMAIDPYIQKYFPQDQWVNAQRVMQAESGGRADAIGDDYPIRGKTIPSYGRFQIRGFSDRPSKEKLLDPEFNTKYAAEMWKKQGWGPWSTAHTLGIVK